MLENDSVILENDSKNEKGTDSKDKIRLTGLEIPLECYTHLKRKAMPEGAIEERIGMSDPDAFQVLLAHNPSYMDEYLDWGADLILSGHLHGGMVRLPGVGGVIGPDFVVFPKYSGEMQKVGDQTVIVSKGLGTHTIHIRLFNPAEIVVIEMNNS